MTILLYLHIVSSEFLAIQETFYAVSEHDNVEILIALTATLVGVNGTASSYFMNTPLHGARDAVIVTWLNQAGGVDDHAIEDG